MTGSMLYAIGETDRRRRVQTQYNLENNITPQTIIKPIDMSLVAIAEADYVTVPLETEDDEVASMTAAERERFLAELEERMREAARQFEFEKAAALRDRLKALKSIEV
jgi:excinuclease ABC subunit B